MKNNETTNDNIVFFDGVCNLCSSFVQFILKNEKNSSIKFASLQSDFTKDFFQKYNECNGTIIFPVIDNEYQSVFYYSNGKLLDRSKAVFSIAKNLKTPYSFVRIFRFIPSRISDFFYKIIAKNRYRWMGKKNECWMPNPKYKARFVG